MKASRMFLAGLAALVLFFACILMPVLSGSSAQAEEAIITEGYEAVIKAARDAVEKQLRAELTASGLAQ